MKTWGSARVGFLALVVGLGLLAPSAVAAPAERLDQKCENMPAQFDSIAFYTVGQSFTPGRSTITSWEAGIWMITGKTLPLQSRLVVHPTGDTAPGGVAGPGHIVAEATATASSRGARYRLVWVRFRPAAPVTVMTVPGVTTPLNYSIEIDFPLNPDIPSGADLSWYACGDRVAGGRAYISFNPEMAKRMVVDGAGKPPGSDPTQPSVRQQARIQNLLFRTYGG